MAGRSSDHRTSHRETHQQEHRPEHGEESIADWQTQALTPFTENLHHRNPELAREIAREYQAVTGTNTAKNHVSWMDDHDQKANHPGAYIYEQRQMTKAEDDILLSYRHAAEHMDQVQADFASTTIMEAMTHRTNAHFSEHFPPERRRLRTTPRQGQRP